MGFNSGFKGLINRNIDVLFTSVFYSLLRDQQNTFNILMKFVSNT